MPSLTPKQRAHLRGLAHPLKPILQIGKEGVSDAAVRTVENAFNTRELLKVKVLETAPQSAKESGELLAELIKDALLVHVIGRTITLYRRHPEKPKINFPS